MNYIYLQGKLLLEMLQTYQFVVVWQSYYMAMLFVW